MTLLAMKVVRYLDGIFDKFLKNILFIVSEQDYTNRVQSKICYV